jgi:hypothetical protein
MWTTRRYDRGHPRRESDLTDEAWPEVPPAKPGGNKRAVDIRDIATGETHCLNTLCQRHAIATDLPPKGTIHKYSDPWHDDRTTVFIMPCTSFFMHHA